jgi:hypothetical protein
MLEIKLERALEPEQMKEQPCGICGADFEPEAVLAQLVTAYEYIPTCDVCLDHLARRAREEAIRADWNDVYLRYIDAVAKYPEPVFPSEEALEAAEMNDPTGSKPSDWAKV